MSKLSFLLLLAVAMLGACAPKSPDDSKIIATVNGEVITEKNYEDYLKARQVHQPPVVEKDKEREVVLDEMINRVLLTQEAKKRKLEQELDVYFQLKRQEENTLVRAMLRQYLRDNPISDEEIKARFDKEMEQTHKTEYRARHILVKTEGEARDIIAKLRSGAKFADLAKKHSGDLRSSKDGGDLGWFNQGSMVPEFFNAVSGIGKGELSEPVKTEFGWHVIQLEDSRPWQTPPFEEVKANIRQLVQQERVEAMVQELKTKAKIKTDL